MKRMEKIVAAIDIGQTYSGYAFASLSDHRNNPSNVSMRRSGWSSGNSGGLLSPKTPTCVVFTDDEAFYRFGFKAEDFYANYALVVGEDKWRFYSKFKTSLEAKSTNSNLAIEDSRGRKMSTKKVFAEVIKYLMEELLKDLDARGIHVDNKDIKWVLTVPTVWPEMATQRMRDASIMAGIDGGQLSIVPEPLAACMYCQTLPCHMLQVYGQQDKAVDISTPGSKFMIIDIGGERTVFTMYERQSDGNVCELHKPETEPWGGSMVDAAFFKLLVELIGTEVFDKFLERNADDYVLFKRELEIKKRTTTPSMDRKVSFRCPVAIADIYKEVKGEDLRKDIHNSAYQGKIIMSSQYHLLRMDSDLFKGLFNECADNVVQKVQQLLTSNNMEGTNTFLMTGGFSESKIIQETLRKAFQKGNIIIPEDPGLAVVKGAVIYGHQEKPVFLISRVA